MPETKESESTSELRQQAQRAESLRKTIAPEAPIEPRPVRRYRARVFQGYLVAATVVFGLFFFYARNSPYFSFDLPVARWVQHWHTFWLDVLMQGVSALGFTPMAPIFVGLTIVFVYLMGLKWESVMLVFAGVGVGVLDIIVKLAVHRHRPTPELLDVFRELYEYSFPSGHVLLFTVFLGFLLFLIFTLTPRSWKRTAGSALLVVLIALIGSSRVYMGQHWPSDVIGAHLLGSLLLTLTVYVYRKGKTRFFVHQPLAPGKPPAES